MDTRKRGRPEANANGGAKKSKSASESSGIGSKSKPCMKYFSMVGCPFGENCHFLHYFPGGYNAVAQMMNLPPISTSSGPTNIHNGSSAPAVKTKLCNNYKTPEGCKFGDKCNFAHGEWELGRSIAPLHEEPRTLPPISALYSSRMEPQQPPPPRAAATFGASATAKISVDASLTGAIIGKGGVNSKQICRQTGAKLAIRDHETDSNLRNIELEGSFEQIKEASAMVRELILSVSVGAAGGAPATHHTAPAMHHGAPAMHHGAPAHKPVSNKKTKLCENFTKGSCTFGERCHFAHGAAELRKTGV